MAFSSSLVRAEPHWPSFLLKVIEGACVSYFILLLLVPDCKGSFRENSRFRNSGRGQSWRSNGEGRHNTKHDWREPATEDWDEERQLALALQLKVIQKMSMKKWIKERHVLWPSRPTIQRLKVEEREEEKLNELRSQGWVPSNELASFDTIPKTNWIKIAQQVIVKNKETRSSHKKDPIVEL